MRKGVISVLSALAGALIGVCIVEKASLEKMDALQDMSDKHLSLFKMMNRWVEIKQEGKNLAEYFIKEGYNNIAVYGMSYAGETLISELKDTGVNVAYGIDKNADSIYASIEMVSTEGELKQVDAIVVTAISYYDVIERELSKKITCPIISLEHVLHEI